MSSDSARVALLVTDILERLSIAYAVEGSIGTSDYGIARSTLDANIIADLQPEHVAVLVSALSGEFYADHHAIENAIEHRSSFTVVHYSTKFNVDVFIPKLRPFDQMQLKRRRASAVSTSPARQVSVTSPEDSILSKLERYRTGGAGQDRELSRPRLLAEVVGILKSQAVQLDLDYLRHWADELKVEDLLKDALRQASYEA